LEAVRWSDKTVVFSFRGERSLCLEATAAGVQIQAEGRPGQPAGSGAEAEVLLGGYFEERVWNREKLLGNRVGRVLTDLQLKDGWLCVTFGDSPVLMFSCLPMLDRSPEFLLYWNEPD